MAVLLLENLQWICEMAFLDFWITCFILVVLYLSKVSANGGHNKGLNKNSPFDENVHLFK